MKPSYILQKWNDRNLPLNREEAPDLNGTDRRVFSSIIQAPLQMTENDIILDLWYKDPF